MIYPIRRWNGELKDVLQKHTSKLEAKVARLEDVIVSLREKVKLDEVKLREGNSPSK